MPDVRPNRNLGDQARGLSEFFCEMLRSPKGTGAFFPSSPALAKRIVSLAGVASARRVIEIGPGTGSFTSEILSRIPEDGRFCAVERNSAFVQHLRGRFPNAEILEGCATELSAIVQSSGIGAAESMVSGLPWANFSPDLQFRILTSIRSVMSDGAVFTTFAYFGPHLFPAGRRFRHLLRELFTSVETSPIEIFNLPPAFVYYCRV